MRTPSILAAALLMAAAASGYAAPATPGTKTPHSSGDWGPDEAALRRKASALFAKLIDEAHKGVTVDGKKVPYAKNPSFKVDLDHSVIGGSPAAAFQAGVGLNKTGDFSGSDLVYAGSALFEMVDQAEAAMFLAHEIGHLAYAHPKTMEDKKMALVDKLYSEWEVSHTIPAGEPSSETVKRFLKDSSARLSNELAPLQRPYEDDADRYGLALAVQAGYSGDAAVNSFLRAKDWLAAKDADESDPAHPGTVAERAAKTAERLAADRAAAERAKLVARRAKCASEGTSCE
jgi:hypothetical protein